MRTPADFRLVSRALWPRGMVTRWRVLRHQRVFDPPIQTAACAELVPSSQPRYAARVSVTTRLWGPFQLSYLETYEQIYMLVNGKRVIPDLAVTFASAKRAVGGKPPVFGSAWRAADFSVLNRFIQPRLNCPSGSYAESKAGLAVSVDLRAAI